MHGGHRWQWPIRNLPRHVARMRLAYAVLLISLTATLLVFSYSRTEVRRRQQQSFQQACEKHRHTLDLFNAAYVNILHGLSAYCAPDFRLDPTSFQEYVEALCIKKEVAACMFDVGFILRTTPAEREALLEMARDLHVAETNLARFPATNAENYVLIHWQNLQGPTATAFATHVFTDEGRLSAMFRARDRNALACTERLDMHLGNNQSAPGAFIVSCLFN